jgi:ABC-type nitrate/sulfonate/bicarbonate transport system substrate-binding protein
MNRRRFLRFVGAGALAAPAVARAQPSVKIGTAVLGSYILAGPVIAAVEKGFFREQGLNAEFVPFRGGPDLVKAVIAGDVLIGLTGSTDIIVFREAGMPIRMTATQGEGNDFVLVGPPEGARMADLKGKSIGVTRAGAATWVFARMAARAQGWDPDRDVTIVALGGLDAQLAALARKEIAAYVWGDYGASTEAQGRTKLVFRLDSLTPRWISSIQYSSDEQIKKNADQIRRATRAIFQAMHFMRTQPQDAAAVIGAKLNWAPDVVAAVHRAWTPYFPEDGRIRVENLKAMQEALLDAGSVRKRVPLEEHYTMEFTPIRS